MTMRSEIREQFKIDVLDLTRTACDLRNGEAVLGEAISNVIKGLRRKGWRRIPPIVPFIEMLEEAGFRVVKGRTCRTGNYSCDIVTTGGRVAS